jgi:hypothetical protein
MAIGKQIVRILLLLLSAFLALVFLLVPFGSHYSPKTARAFVEYHRSPNEATKRAFEAARAHDEHMTLMIELVTDLYYASRS